MKITFVGAVGIVAAIVVAILAIRYLLNRGNDGLSKPRVNRNAGFQ